MNKLLDLLAEIEASVEWAVDDRKDREKIMDWIHQALDIAVQGKAHKWPEEKPKHGKEYLVYSKDEEYGCAAYIIAEWKDYLTADQCRGPYGDIWEKDNFGWYYYSDDLYLISVDGVECYWNLPEMTE